MEFGRTWLVGSSCLEERGSDLEVASDAEIGSDETDASKLLKSDDSGESSSQELINVKTLSIELVSGAVVASDATGFSVETGSTHVAESKIRRSKSLTLS
jgi:hypothetical protein